MFLKGLGSNIIGFFVDKGHRWDELGWWSCEVAAGALRPQSIPSQVLLVKPEYTEASQEAPGKVRTLNTSLEWLRIASKRGQLNIIRERALLAVLSIIGELERVDYGKITDSTAPPRYFGSLSSRS